MFPPLKVKLACGRLRRLSLGGQKATRWTGALEGFLSEALTEELRWGDWMAIYLIWVMAGGRFFFIIYVAVQISDGKSEKQPADLDEVRAEELWFLFKTTQRNDVRQDLGSEGWCTYI